jgi:membrane protease YdiL (CAAX protease family)
MTSDNPPVVANIPPRLTHSVSENVRWGVSDIGWAIGALALSVVGGLLLSASGIQVDTDAAQFWIGMAGYALIVVVIVQASYRKGQRSLKKDFFLAFRPIDLLIGLGAGIGARILSVLFVLAAVSLTDNVPENGNLVLSDEPLWIVLNGFVLAVFVGPFVEELLVRGLVLQAVRNIVLRWRNRPQPAEPAQQKRALWISVLVSAVVFSLLHSGQSDDVTVVLALGLSTFTLGVINAWLVYATGRLGSAIVSHVVFNGSSVVLAVVAGGLLSV